MQTAKPTSSAVEVSRNWITNKTRTPRPAAAALMFLGLACMTTGCSKPSVGHQILGKWDSDDASLALSYRFDKGGKWSSQQILPRISHSSTGSWKLDGRAVVITTEGRTLTLDGKPKPPAPVGGPERDEIVTLDDSRLVLKVGSKDGRNELASFHRAR